ncbi:MAG: LPS export ABC transporter periplasmic protein LptC [Candidatus Rokuibacteriota bacterium]
MRKITHGILIGVAAFVLIVAGTLVVRSRSARVESLGPAATGADLHIKEVDLAEESKGVRWRLRARQALMYEQEGRTSLKELAVQVFERDRSWTIVGEEGNVEKTTRNVEVRGNVVVTSSDGMRLETTVLRWDARERRLWTDAGVTLSRDRSLVRGIGLDVRMESEETIIGGRVSATFVAPRRVP